MSIGEKLKNLRLEMNKTLNEQSKALGVSINTIYRWENDITVPKKNNLVKLAEFYNKPIDRLFFGNAFEKPVQTEAEIEQRLLETFRKLPVNNKYRVLGYIDCMRAEVPEGEKF